MGEVTIRLRHNPSTGKKVLTVSYESEADLLPHEHERDHRALVEALIGRPLGDDVGEIRIERISKETEGHGAPEPEAAPAGRTPQREPG